MSLVDSQTELRNQQRELLYPGPPNGTYGNPQTIKTVTIPVAAELGDYIDTIAGDGFAKDIRIWSNTTATITVAASDSGTTYIAKRSSSTQTFTLPSASTAGLTYTFINGNVDGMIYIKGQSGDTINCKSNADGTDRVSVSVLATTGIRNNAATNVLGDNITLVSDGITTWWMTAQSGIFSSL
jgi:hypothetical protein